VVQGRLTEAIIIILLRKYFSIETFCLFEGLLLVFLEFFFCQIFLSPLNLSTLFSFLLDSPPFLRNSFISFALGIKFYFGLGGCLAALGGVVLGVKFLEIYEVFNVLFLTVIDDRA